MHISLLCTTRDRVADMRRLLESLARQSYTDFTLILGPQQETGEASDSLDALLRQFDGSIRIIRRDLPLCSLSRARNLLLPLAEGDIIALTDDDCWYPPETFEKIARVFMENPEAGVLIGSQLPDQSPEITQENRFTLLLESASITLFFRKACTDAVGLFDEDLGTGAPTPWQSGEETDYLVRAFDAGFSVLRKKDILVLHPALDVSSPASRRKAYGYSLGRMRLLKKHAYPFWFTLANVSYPLCILPVDIWEKGVQHIPYRLSMFAGRVAGLLKK